MKFDDIPSLPSEIRKPIRQAANHPWFERLARLGFAAKGTVYIVIGLLAAQAAFGLGGKTTDSKGALREILIQPFGQFLLIVITVGLVGYILWRLVQTILDPEHSGQKLDAKRIVQRIGYAMSALTYTGLALTAVELLIGTERSSSGHTTQSLTARLLAQPFGQWLVATVGAIVIGVSISYFYRAYKAQFRRRFKLYEMSSVEEKWATYIGRFGIAARGVVFSIIGIFLVLAAVRSDASEAKSSEGVLVSLAQQPFGPWILSTVALGLIAYGGYAIVNARYRSFARV